jgi:hypothetical protein
MTKDSSSDSVFSLFREKPLQTTGTLWALCLGGTVLYLWRRQIPLQLKIIQGRILAQASVISALALIAYSSYASHDANIHNHEKKRHSIRASDMYDIEPAATEKSEIK